MKIYTIICLTLVASSVSLFASETDIKTPPFLFSEDEQVKSVDILSSVKVSDELKKNTFLNAPMTKLDYLLENIEKVLNESENISLIQGDFKKYFGQYQLRGFAFKFEVKGSARYVLTLGKVFVGYSIDNAGTPKKPLKEICRGLISNLSVHVPQDNPGYLYHNTAFGVLIQDDYSAYNEVVKTLTKNIVLRASINVHSDNGKILQQFICVKESANSEIIYQKSSSRFK